ncbi:hypothetical protein AADZ90_011105 [Aestuariibius sp. 2305UL40-4]|uniref:hypothetical protein n=1 Tax=Aestuariibius violaceus TaxID=3234132 RepID=UPI00345ECC45
MTRLLALLFLLALPAAAEDKLALVMVEREGCAYCARWDAEIAPIWPKTEVGQAAPLRRVAFDALPGDLSLEGKPPFTPTFILVRNGVELDRLEGYSGEHFFWPLVERMVADAQRSDGNDP